MAMLVKWILLLLGLIAECVGEAVIEKPTTDNFDIKFDNKVVCKVDRKFISIAISSGQLNKTGNGYFDSGTKLRNLFKGLSPCYVRVGGTRANFLEFEPRDEDMENPEDILSPLQSCAYSSQPSSDENTGVAEEDKKNEKKGKRKMKMRMKNKMKKKGDKGDGKEKENNKEVTEGTAGTEGTEGNEDTGKPEDVGGPENPEDPDPMPQDSAQSDDDDDESRLDNRDLPEEGEKEEKKHKRKGIKGMKGKKEDKKEDEYDRAAHKARKKKKFAAYRNYKLTADQFDGLYQLVNGTGNTMLFDINAFARPNANISWDSTNAAKLIQYAEKKGYNIDWQFGNEPNHYYKFKKCEQTGKQVGEDYVAFKKLVSRLDTNKPKALIVGPDVTQPKVRGKTGLINLVGWLDEFLMTGADSIDALAWHHYYVDGKNTNETFFLDATIMDSFDWKIKWMKDFALKYNFTKPLWLTESGTAWGGGAPDLSNRFAGMFLYVDKLGVGARNCMQVIARQAFLDGKYAMVNKTNLNPFPEYYAAALLKRLGKNDVLNVTTNKNDTNFRAYARCARGSKDGAILLYILNLSEDPKTFAFPAYESVKVKQFLFTAESMQSDVVLLNGKPLEMDGDKLPQMKGIEDVEQPVKIPGRSIGYYIVNTDSLDICKKSSE